MVSDEKVMSTCSKRIHEVKHTLHLNDESKHLDTRISTFTFRNKNTGLTNRCLHRHSHVHIQKQKHWTPNRCLKLTIHRTEPYSLMSLLYFCGHLEYIPGAHLEPCRELFSFQLFTQKKLHHRYHNRLGSQYASVN